MPGAHRSNEKSARSARVFANVTSPRGGIPPKRSVKSQLGIRLKVNYNEASVCGLVFVYGLRYPLHNRRNEHGVHLCDCAVMAAEVV